jgi:hypothetical protein
MDGPNVMGGVGPGATTVAIGLLDGTVLAVLRDALAG